MDTKFESKPDLEPEPALNTPDSEPVPDAEHEPEFKPGPGTKTEPDPEPEPGSNPKPGLGEPEPGPKRDYPDCTSFAFSGPYRVICGKLEFCGHYHHEYYHYLRSNKTYKQYSCKLCVAPVHKK